jgi:hypothetical protein
MKSPLISSTSPLCECHTVDTTDCFRSSALLIANGARATRNEWASTIDSFNKKIYSTSLPQAAVEQKLQEQSAQNIAYRYARPQVK